MNISFINLRKLSTETKINYFTLYRSFKGERSKKLTLEERTSIVKALTKALKPFVKELGFEIDITRLPE